MSQPSVAAYFSTRKRPANEELRNKAKVLLLGDDERKEVLGVMPSHQPAPTNEVLPVLKKKMETKKEMVSRNLQFDLSSKPVKPTKPRLIKSRRPSVNEDNRQLDIRETMFKIKQENEDDKKVIFEKLGNLSPKKLTRKKTTKSAEVTQVEEKVQESTICKTPTKELAICKTPTKTPIKDLSYDEIKKRVTTSARLTELRARIAQFKNSEKKLENLEQAHLEKRKDMKKNDECVKIKEFERIQLEIPVSPQKALLSPNKFFSPTKSTVPLSPKASPARRLLFEPKEAPASPVKASPTKVAAYQRYQTLVDTEGKALPLPYKYRFLAEIFRSMDTVSAMLYNRREVITFSKLRSAVQELVRRNFTLEHLAQIKTIYPEAYKFHQEKMRSFGTGKSEKYELVITPNIEINSERSGRNTPDEENVLKSALNTHMSPNVLLERKRKFNNALLEIVKDEHEKFLLNLDTPMKIPKEKITRWHPDFDIENCRDIQKAELPQPPIQEKLSTAKDVLEKAHNLFNNNARMKKAIELLADSQTKTDTPTQTTEVTITPSTPVHNLNSSIVDTPPTTPQTPKTLSNPALKGIPTSLLEKIRAKQAAKAMEMMTRSTDANKEAVMYGRLPEMAKIVRNIFVSEKKNVLMLEQVVKKLDDSYRTKLTASELEEHLRLLCKLLPLWIAIHIVRKINYLKLAKDYDMTKVMKRLEVLANEKA